MGPVLNILNPCISEEGGDTGYWDTGENICFNEFSAPKYFLSEENDL